MNNKTFILIISACLTFCFLMAMMLLVQATGEDSIMNRIGILLGGELPGGLIQGFIYFLFCYGWLESKMLTRSVDREASFLDKSFLPEHEQQVLLPEHINEIKMNMIRIERKEKSTLSDLIKQACTKFRSSQNVNEVMDLIRAQVSIYNRRTENEQNTIRYILNAIPSVGFIGTVLGIAASLGKAGDAVSGEGLEGVTSMLYIAFDTTLVALIFSLLLMFIYNGLQTRVENYYADMEAYVLENLVNRIYRPMGEEITQ